MSKYGVFSDPYFPAFSPNTGKYGPEKTPYMDTFHAVIGIYRVLNIALVSKILAVTNKSFNIVSDLRNFLKNFNTTSVVVSVVK